MSDRHVGEAAHSQRFGLGSWFFLLGGFVLLAGLIALGTWQLERRTWKHGLMARVEQRVHAPAVAAPGAADWPHVNAVRDEYRRVIVAGEFLHDKEALVQAVTDLGSGFWVLTPLRRTDGTTVLINRGFVPAEAHLRSVRAATEPSGPVTLRGLLRLTEPGGAFLRSNDAVADRWFSRDVAALAASRGLVNVAPYFVDVEASDAAVHPPLQPVGGLTVLTFTDHHLLYALTWYALALMVAGAIWRVLCEPGWRSDGLDAAE